MDQNPTDDRRVLHLWGHTFHLEERGLAIDEVVPFVTQLTMTVDQLTRRVAELEAQVQQQAPGLALGQLPLWGRRFTLVEAGLAVDETVPFIADLMASLQAQREQLEVMRRRLDRIDELEQLAEAKLLAASRLRESREPLLGLAGEPTQGPGLAEVSPLQQPLPLGGAPDPADRAEAEDLAAARETGPDAEVAEILPDAALATAPPAPEPPGPEPALQGQKVTIEDHPAATPRVAIAPEEAPGTITAAEVSAAESLTGTAPAHPPAPAPADAPEPAALEEPPVPVPAAAPEATAPVPAPDHAPPPAPPAAAGTYQGEVTLRFSPAASIADVIRIQETLGRVQQIHGLVSVTRPEPGTIACIVRVLDPVPLVEILDRQPGFHATAASATTIDIALS